MLKSMLKPGFPKLRIQTVQIPQIIVQNQQVHPLNKLFEKIVYINLKGRPDRRIHMEELFNGEGIEAERFEGIENKIGWVGCTKSHLQILKDFRDSSLNNILIFEDDVYFIKNYKTYLDFKLDFDFDMLFFGIKNPKWVDKKIYNFQRTTRGIRTHMYCVQKQCVNFLIEKIEKHDRAIDETYDKIFIDLKVYVIRPNICHQNRKIKSDIKKTRAWRGTLC
jgi:GR25 family glycosyltransferase involved in LPS biosynthesis